MSKSSPCTLYLLILVGSNRSEDSLREAEDLEDAPADTEEVICLHNVEARLVTMHGVEDDLTQRQTKEKVLCATIANTPCKVSCGDSQDIHFKPGMPARDCCPQHASIVTVQTKAFARR